MPNIFIFVWFLRYCPEISVSSVAMESALLNIWYVLIWIFNTLRPRRDGRHFPDDIFKRIFLNENVWILIKISLKFVPKGPINNIPALVQIMAWRRPGDKPLFEPMMASLLTHIWVTRPQWANSQMCLSHCNEDLIAWMKKYMLPELLKDVCL